MYSYICYTFISSPNQKSFFRESEHLLDNVFSEFRRDRLENERGIVFETLFRQYFNSFTFTYPVVFADGRGAAADRQTTPPLRTILGFSWSIRSYSYSSSSGCRPPISFSGLHACVWHSAFLERCSLLVLTIVERDRTIASFVFLQSLEGFHVERLRWLLALIFSFLTLSTGRVFPPFRGFFDNTSFLRLVSCVQF